MVATHNQNKCPPEKQHIFLTELKAANAMKHEVHHAGAVRNALQSEENVTIHYWSEKLGELYS